MYSAVDNLPHMPQDPVDFVRMSYPRLREVLDALAWRLVDHVAVQLQGKTVCMTSLPMLHTLAAWQHHTGRSADVGPLAWRTNCARSCCPLRVGGVQGPSDTTDTEVCHHERAHPSIK